MLIPLVRICALLCLASCATIIDGGADVVPIDSVPTGATIRLDGVAVGVTPAQVSVARTCKGQVVVQHAGYHDEPIDLTYTANGWYFGNLIFGGLVGMIIDMATGNAYRWNTDAIMVKLTPSSEISPAQKRAIEEEKARAEFRRKAGPPLREDYSG